MLLPDTEPATRELAQLTAYFRGSKGTWRGKLSAMPVQALPPDQILQKLAKLFMTPAHDRHVYCVFGQYARLRPFQKRLQEAVVHGDFNSLGLVEYLSLNTAVPEHMRTLGTFEKAQQLARDRHDDEFRQLLSQALRDLVTRKIEASKVVGLVLAWTLNSSIPTISATTTFRSCGRWPSMEKASLSAGTGHDAGWPPLGVR